MKVSKTVPKAWRGPVKVSSTCYELWALTPSKLGEINKVSNYWLTKDGVRFISSRDAADYMLKLNTLNLSEDRRVKNEPIKVERRAELEPLPVIMNKVLGKGLINTVSEQLRSELKQSVPNLAVKVESDADKHIRSLTLEKIKKQTERREKLEQLIADVRLLERELAQELKHE